MSYTEICTDHDDGNENFVLIYLLATALNAALRLERPIFEGFLLTLNAKALRSPPHVLRHEALEVISRLHPADMVITASTASSRAALASGFRFIFRGCSPPSTTSFRT